MNHKGFARLGIILMVLTSAAAVMGMGFGLWQQVLSITETVNTGTVNLQFDATATDDNGVVEKPGYDDQDDDGISLPQIFDYNGTSSSPDPAATGRDPKDHFDKDVGKCDALTDFLQTASVVKDNVYPQYHCTAWFDVQNYGSVPVKVRRVTLTSLSGPADVLPGPLTTTSPTPLDLDDTDYDGDNATGSDVEVYVSDIELCQQIDPGETVVMNLDQRVLQEAPQDGTLSWSVQVEIAQWNELGSGTVTTPYGFECEFIGSP